MSTTVNTSEATQNSTVGTTGETSSIADDLVARLARVTEYKEPGDTSTASSKNAEKNFWDSSDDDFEPVPNEQPKVKEKEAETKAQHKTKAEIEKEERRAELDAITIVGAIQFTQNTIMRPIVNRKYQKKFSEAEINKLEKIADKQIEDYTADEISLKNKFERLMVNRDKLMGKIPLTDEQEKDLTDIWKRYFEVTGKSIPPWLGVAIASVNTIGSRIIDIAFD